MCHLAADLCGVGMVRRFKASAVLLACLTLAVIPARAQTQAAAAPENGERQMRLQVVDGDTGRPLHDVKVRAWVRTKPTDSSGVCIIPLPKPQEDNFSYRVTLSRDGYVGQFITWSKAQGDKVETMPTNVTAKLEKGVSIGGIVMNEKGEPVPGAKVVLSGPLPTDMGERARTVVAPGYHAERTDENGRWHFAEAPRDFEKLTFHVNRTDYVPAVFAAQEAQLDDGTILLPKADFLAGKAAMTLGHGIELSGRVVDSAGKPVADAALTRNHEWRNPAAALTTDTNGEFKIVNLKPGGMYLTVQAKGLAGQSLLLTLSNQMPELKIQMAPGKIFRGKLVDPAGKPIAGASAQMDRMELGPMEYEWSVVTDAEGRFAWDSAPDGEHPYCFSAAGFHPRTESSMAADGQEHVITLRPVIDSDKTMIDGYVSDVNSKAPLTNFTIYVKQYNGQAIAHSQQTFTNADGHYSVAIDSTASAYVISAGAAKHKPEGSNMKTVGDGDLRLNFGLEGGFAMTGLLYRLEGKFVLNGYQGKIPWTNEQFYLSTVVPPPVLAASEPGEESAEFEKFLETPEGAVWQRAHRSYEVEIDNNGAFKIEDVPEGSYALKVNLRQPQAQAPKPIAGECTASEPIAGLCTNIDVPDLASKTRAIMDLGSLDLTLKKALRVDDDAPAFAVKTVDGAPLRLADFRGKYVLLDFWATWCGPCRGETPFLKATYRAFGGNDHFAMISLSLDNSPAAPKDFAVKNNMPWIQGFLGKWADSTVTPLYGVEGIPSIFLIGPDGKIVAKDLRGEAIKEAVGNALGNPLGKN